MDEQSTRTPGQICLPQAAQNLLPHRPPMLLVKTLAASETSCSIAFATLPTAGIFITEAGILPEYFIELIAQTAALGNCYDAVASGLPPRQGMLVGVDSFSWRGRPVPGSPVRIETKQTYGFGAIKSMYGEVYDGDKMLAAGTIKVWEAPEMDNAK